MEMIKSSDELEKEGLRWYQDHPFQSLFWTLVIGSIPCAILAWLIVQIGGLR